MFLKNGFVRFVRVDAQLQRSDSLPGFFGPRGIGLKTDYALVFANERRRFFRRDLLMLLFGGKCMLVGGFLLRVAAASEQKNDEYYRKSGFTPDIRCPRRA